MISRLIWSIRYAMHGARVASSLHEQDLFTRHKLQCLPSSLLDLMLPVES